MIRCKHCWSEIRPVARPPVLGHLDPEWWHVDALGTPITMTCCVVESVDPRTSITVFEFAEPEEETPDVQSHRADLAAQQESA